MKTLQTRSHHRTYTKDETLRVACELNPSDYIIVDSTFLIKKEGSKYSLGELDGGWVCHGSAIEVVNAAFLLMSPNSTNKVLA